MKPDEHYMRIALKLAQKAVETNDVPVGAVLVCGGRVVARARNEKEKRGDACAHAEMLALRRAQKKLGVWRLSDCALYVTKEPCAMCAGALVNCRVGRLVYGARDARFGCSGSLCDISGDGRLNHRVETTAGILEADCAALLTNFFQSKR
ncbi:MAG: tRNA adenosine(34) deaminase TadA [Clostridiales bacterium]|jgi:tRNA(adenine34) deaminase|nr:tRNA adenosine(34) deaminase TadA [Clostridiales bacterium]